MTCIVGLVEDGKVYIGGDSAATTNYVTQTLTFRKVFRYKDNCLMGYSGSVRMVNLLQYAFKMPDKPGDMSMECYFATLFADALRTTMKDAGNATKTNEQEQASGYFLVGYQERLFRIGFDYSVVEVAEGFDAIGSGNEVALGAMHATKDMSLVPQKRIELALQAASYFSSGVRGPFFIEELEK